MTASSAVKINKVPFKEWLNVILTVAITLLQDTLIQGIDGCN